jgi:indolepyruvate ferredoxin oxidoreductase beta subunit
METSPLIKNPYNMIIASVGEQDNVTITYVLASMLIEKGLCVATGRNFSALQPGGSVMSHIRVSSNNSTWGPQIPNGTADLIIALEDSEAIRALLNYGNPYVKVLTDIHPMHSSEIDTENKKCLTSAHVRETLKDVAERTWVIDTNCEAQKLGIPNLRSIIMIGAVAGIGVLPITRNNFKEVIMTKLPTRRLDVNLNAFDIGEKLVKV